MKEYLITVIIPVYNVEKYLKRCVKSVLNQTYQNLEIILIDDGSDDTSGDICDEFQEKDERILVIHQDNQGVSSARNYGLDICTGDYITFIDSDDYIDKRYCEELLSCMVCERTQVSMCGVRLSESDGQKKSLYKNMRYNSRISIDDNFNYDKNLFVNSVCGKLYRRDVIGNKRFEERIAIGEDALFFAKILKEITVISYTKSDLYYYWMNMNSVMHEIYTPKWDGFVEAWRLISNIYKDNQSSVIYQTIMLHYMTICRRVYGMMQLSNYKNQKKERELLNTVRRNLKIIWKADSGILQKAALLMFAGIPDMYMKILKIKKLIMHEY